MRNFYFAVVGLIASYLGLQAPRCAQTYLFTVRGLRAACVLLRHRPCHRLAPAPTPPPSLSVASVPASCLALTSPSALSAPVPPAISGPVTILFFFPFIFNFSLLTGLFLLVFEWSQAFPIFKTKILPVTQPRPLPAAHFLS